MQSHRHANWVRVWFLPVPLALILVVAVTEILGSPSQANPSVAKPRTVGGGLHFASPFLPAGVSAQFPNGGNQPTDPAGFDLGDVCPGSAMTRYITALDGVTPYVFSSPDAENLGLTLDPSGRLRGTLSSSAPNPASFTAVVTDTAGVSRTATCFLQTDNCNGFHFAMDTLPQARVGQDYDCNLETNGGSDAVVFSVADGSIQANGVSMPNLESLGLRLFPDGTLAGRPLTSGTITFTAQAVQNGVHATNRAQTSNDQALAINVLDVADVQSVLAASNVLVKLGGSSRDSLTLRAFVNANGAFNSSFSGQLFVLRLGSKTFEATLDRLARARSGNLRVALAAQGGMLNVQLKNLDFSQLFNGASLQDGAINQTVLQIAIGSTFIASEVIPLQVKNRSGHIQLSYLLTRDTVAGGLCQIINLIGTNDFTGTQTSFQAHFLFSPVQPDNSLGLAQQATVNVGPGFSQTVPLNNGSGSFPSGGLQSVFINPRFKAGTVTTFALPQSVTGIAPGPIGQNQTFLLGLDFVAGSAQFSGVASTQISPFTVFNTFVPVFFDPFFPDDGGDDFIDFSLKKRSGVRH